MKQYKRQILDAVKYFIEDQINYWKESWNTKEDVENDLENAKDWFWEEINENFDEFKEILDISEEITDKEIKNYIEKISNEVDEIIELSCGDTEKYYYDFGQEDW